MRTGRITSPSCSGGGTANRGDPRADRSYAVVNATVAARARGGMPADRPPLHAGVQDCRGVRDGDRPRATVAQARWNGTPGSRRASFGTELNSGRRQGRRLRRVGGVRAADGVVGRARPARVIMAVSYACLITSLPWHQARPNVIADAVRGHWRIEALHWIRTVSFGEDLFQGPRTGSGPAVMATLRNFAVSLNSIPRSATTSVTRCPEASVARAGAAPT